MLKTIFFILLFHFSTFASDQIYIDSVSYGGSGCQADEAWGVLSPDQKVLSLLFDNFVVEASQNTHQLRKRCQIKVNINVPSDKIVIIKKIDYRLYAMVPQFGYMEFNSSYNMQIPELRYISRTFNKKKIFRMHTDDEFLISQPMVTALMRSKCGHDFSLNIDTSLDVRTNNLGELVFASIDSLDGGIDYHLEYETCQRNVNHRNNRVETESERMRRLRREEARRRRSR